MLVDDDDETGGLDDIGDKVDEVDAVDVLDELVSEFDEECEIDANAGFSVLICGTLASILVLHPVKVPKTKNAAITPLHNFLFTNCSPFGI